MFWAIGDYLTNTKANAAHEPLNNILDSICVSCTHDTFQVQTWRKNVTLQASWGPLSRVGFHLGSVLCQTILCPNSLFHS